MHVVVTSYVGLCALCLSRAPGLNTRFQMQEEINSEMSISKRELSGPPQSRVAGQGETSGRSSRFRFIGRLKYSICPSKYSYKPAHVSRNMKDIGQNNKTYPGPRKPQIIG